MKGRRAEAHHVGIPRPAEGPQQGEIRDGFEQVGFAMSVLADDHEPGRGNLEVELREVAVVFGDQAGEHVVGAISAQ